MDAGPRPYTKEELIRQVRYREPLWNYCNGDFRDKQLKSMLWEDLAATFEGKTAAACKTEWDNVRQARNNTRNRQARARRSGSGGGDAPKDYIYEPLLKFLDVCEKSRNPTVGNLSIIEEGCEQLANISDAWEASIHFMSGGGTIRRLSPVRSPVVTNKAVVLQVPPLKPQRQNCCEDVAAAVEEHFDRQQLQQPRSSTPKKAKAAVSRVPLAAIQASQINGPSTSKVHKQTTVPSSKRLKKDHVAVNVLIAANENSATEPSKQRHTKERGNVIITSNTRNRSSHSRDSSLVLNNSGGANISLNISTESQHTLVTQAISHVPSANNSRVSLHGSVDGNNNSGVHSINEDVNLNQSLGSVSLISVARNAKAQRAATQARHEANREAMRRKIDERVAQWRADQQRDREERRNVERRQEAEQRRNLQQRNSPVRLPRQVQQQGQRRREGRNGEEANWVDLAVLDEIRGLREAIRLHALLHVRSLPYEESPSKKPEQGLQVHSGYPAE